MKKTIRNKVLLNRYKHFESEYGVIYNHDSLKLLKLLPSESVNCCVTSPPYWGLRDYDENGQYGQERTPKEFVDNLVVLFREFRRVLRKDGVFWLILGDSYYNHRPGGTSQVRQTMCGHKGSVVKKSHKRNTKIDGLKEKDLVGVPWETALALRKDG